MENTDLRASVGIPVELRGIVMIPEKSLFL